MVRWTVYILACEEGKYYVGRTTRKVEDRYREHKEGKGSEWTKRYAPQRLVAFFENAGKYDEDKYVCEYMEKYGMDNVRGGTYSNVQLSYEQKRELQRKFAHANNLCMRCGGEDHWIRDCPLASNPEKRDPKEEEKKKLLTPRKPPSFFSRMCGTISLQESRWIPSGIRRISSWWGSSGT